MSDVKKPYKGGKLPAGSKRTKVTSEKILRQISLQLGKPFEQCLAEGYHASIIACDTSARIQYEKMILSKVVADKHEMDIHSLGQSLVNNFKFQQAELPEWTELPLLRVVDADSK